MDPSPLRTISTHTAQILEHPWIHPHISFCRSNSQLGSHTPFDPTATFVIIQSRLNPLLNKPVHLLRGPPDEALWVKERDKVIFDWVEVWVSLDSLDKIVFETKLLDLVGSLVRQDLKTMFTPSVSCGF